MLLGGRRRAFALATHHYPRVLRRHAWLVISRQLDGTPGTTQDAPRVARVRHVALEGGGEHDDKRKRVDDAGKGKKCANGMAAVTFGVGCIIRAELFIPKTSRHGEELLVVLLGAIMIPLRGGAGNSCRSTTTVPPDRSHLIDRLGDAKTTRPRTSSTAPRRKNKKQLRRK